MIEHLLDNNVISQILKGNQTVTNFVVGLNFAICATVYIEALQGSISNAQKTHYQKTHRQFSVVNDYAGSFRTRH